MTPKKNGNEPRKGHPFLFFLLIFGLGYAVYYAWDNWSLGMRASRIQNIVRSSAIENLLQGQVEFNPDGVDEALAEYEIIAEQLGQKVSTLFPHSIKEPHSVLGKDQADLEKADKGSQPPSITQDVQIHSLESNAKPSGEEADPQGATPLEKKEDVVNIALREVFVSQGSDGSEVWRLKADWATFREETDLLNFGAPSLLYRTGDYIAKNQASTAITASQDPQQSFFENSNDLVFLTAEQGIMYDNNNTVQLTNNVLAKQATNFIQGQRLTFDNSERQVVFPERANFQGEGIQGSAEALRWDLEAKLIYGSGGVTVLWTPQENPETTP